MHPDTSFPLSGLTLDTEAMDCWQLAARIGASRAGEKEPARNFTSLLLALLYADNAWSRWFLRYGTALPLPLTEIGAKLQFDPAQLKAMRVAESANGANTPVDEALTIDAPAEGWTTSVQNIFEGAAEVHLTTSGGSAALGVRHLIGAYFYRLPSDHQAQMKDWGFELSRDASALVRQVRRRVPGEEKAWIDLHQSTFSGPPALDASDPLPASRISSFAADTSDGEDQLDIEDDVYALSALICSRRITPPLSIGLFGDWGSGKSFFIRQLQKGAAWISAQARANGRLQRELPFFKHVVQIEFNAWNYSAGNLWAALVQHILENLRLSRDEDNSLVEARRAHLQQKMELERKVRDAAEQKRDEAKCKLQQAETSLATTRSAHEAKVQQLAKMRTDDVLRTVDLGDDTKTQINTLLTGLGLQQASGSAADFLSALDGSRALLKRGSALWGELPSDDKKSFLAGAGVVLLVPPLATVAVAALIYGIDPYISGVAAAASWLSATLGAAAHWLRRRNAEVNEQLGKIEALHARVRQRVDAAQQDFRTQAAALEQQISLARDEVAAAQTQQQEAAARLEKIEQVLAATTPASVLADFVRERSESDDYRKHLGLPAVIRRDFENISNMIAQENLALDKLERLPDEERDAAQRINRIVLYIDDLDRCSEELVVEVLKAVHLLLAFPLFVVVVAVDARWVSRSLSKRFPGLLSSAADTPGGEPVPASDHATTEDYLEKIFQIPFWLRPPSDAAARKMLRSLVPEGVAEVATALIRGKAPPGGAVSQATSAFKQRRHDTQAKTLDITLEELRCIDALAPLLEHSPRALKRFVNIYRLLKASLPPDEASGFLEEQGSGPFAAPYQRVLWLLALANGLKRFSDSLFTAVMAVPASPAARTSAQANLGELVAALKDTSLTASYELARVEAWLTASAKDAWQATDPLILQPWVQRVSRYSYQLFGCIWA
jgi:hypothetical protein